MGELNVRSAAVSSINKLMEKHENGSLAALELSMKRVTLDNLEAHYARFMDAHMSLVGAAIEATELTAHSGLLETVEDKYSNVKALLNSAIEDAAFQQELQRQNDGSGYGTARSSPVHRNNSDDVRLEKIVIPEFSGEFNKWIGFRDMFEAMVHTKEHLSTTVKYTRLMKALKGSAAQVVAGFLPTDDNYESAWTTLKARYDNARLIVTSHLNIFLGMPPLDKESNSGLRRLVDITNETTRSLAAMKRPVETWDDILVHILVSKLPKATIISWEMEQKGTELPKLSELLEFIEGRARGLDHMSSTLIERVSAANPTNLTNPNRRAPPPKAHTSTGNTGNLSKASANQPTKCPKCGGQHPLRRCPVVEAIPVNERFAAIKDLQVCYNCFSPTHMAKSCDSNYRCRNCQGKHNTILCRTNLGNQAGNQTGNLAGNQAQSNGPAPTTTRESP